MLKKINVYCLFDAPMQGTPAKICINPILPELESLDTIFSLRVWVCLHWICMAVSQAHVYDAI